MPLHSSQLARERILLMGPYGSGKSNARVMLWYWLQQTQAPGRIFLMDTDEAAFREADLLGPTYLPSIAHQQCWDWEDFAIIDQWSPHATPEDWLIIDRGDVPWARVQDWYVEKVWGKDSAEFFLDYKQKNTDKGGTPLADAHGSNWDVINKNYRAWWTKVRRWPGHVMVCTDVKPVDRSNDDVATIQTFGSFGKPAGQKDMGKEMHTILMMSHPNSGQWMMTTVRDRNRTELVGVQVTDWVTNYLMAVGGWVQ